MEFGDGDNEELDTFVTAMKNNTVLECRIIQLKSFINSLKKELNDINHQIKEQQELNKRLSFEADIKQASELQTRTRIAALDSSKQLVNKLCNDLHEQVILEKRRYEETKRSHEVSIKNQLAKWEEYQEIYKMFPLAKEVENAEIKLKSLEISKKISKHELQILKKKSEDLKVIREKRMQISKMKLENAQIKNEELKKLKEELQNKKNEMLQSVDDLKQQISELRKAMKEDAENVFNSNIKRKGETFRSNYISDSVRQNFDSTNIGNCFVNNPNDVPELPQLQLPEIIVPSRKVRRIDMIDTTLQRPIFSNFSKSKSYSQPLQNLSIDRNIILQNISSTQGQNVNKISKNNYEKQDDNNSNNIVIREGSSQIFQKENINIYKPNNHRIVVKPIMTDRNLNNHTQNYEFGLNDKNSLTDESDEKVNDTITQGDNEERMEDDYDCNNDNVTENNNKGQHVQEGSVPMDITISTEKNNDNNKNDDGYFSQSQSIISTQSQPLPQSHINKSTVNDCHHIKKTMQQQTRMSISSEHPGISEGGKQRSATLEVPTSSVSTTGKEMEGVQSKYFMPQQREIFQHEDRNVFKSPPLPPQKHSNINLAASTVTSPGMELKKSVGLFNSEKRNQSKDLSHPLSQLAARSNAESVESQYFISSENDMSPWTKSPTPSRGMSSPPDTPAFNESYLNLLSPPAHRESINVPGTSKSPGEQPKTMNMFGGATAQETNPGGFSFISKVTAPSSFFSMFK